jgi:hypothetical protein
MADLIPGALLEAVRRGEVVLFLGAGASRGADSDNGTSIPDGPALAKALADRFLGGEDADRPLAVVAELAISENDPLTVQTFIKEMFSHFHPASFHNLLPTVRWTALVTTNYDLIIEESYAAVPGAVQKPVPFVRNSDRVEQRLRAADALPLLKLHGCISHYTEIDVPLILTIDQYVTHRKGRDRLFSRFRDFASESTVVFVGHALEDADLRQAIIDVSTEDISRPRYWVVAPSPSERQSRFWETKRISTIPLTFQSFLEEIDRSLPRGLRAIATIPSEAHPIQKRFVKAGKTPSSDLLAFLQNDVTYLRSDLPALTVNPKDFYKGFDGGWGAIQQELDAKRHLTDTFLSDTVLLEDVDRPTTTDVYVLKGYAGAGKTILLRRIAWDAATAFGKLCLFANPGCRLPFPVLAELAELVGERIFLFVDHPVDALNELTNLVRLTRSRNLPLTVVCAERSNEWNNECATLSTFVNELFEVRYLSVQEIGWLLDKLTLHKSLGTLEGKSRDVQERAFVEVADKQLIVALHEATSGLHFRDIVFNEFSRIQPPQAQSIYLTICALNRLNVPVRAGVVRRVHNVSFEQFKKDFFMPLDGLVYTEPYTPARDMAYRARHPWIAEVVFQRALPTAKERYDLYMQIVAALDVGYEADRKAYRGIIRARDLISLFDDPVLVRNLYEATKELAGDDPYHHQQRAIYEMRRENPNFSLAYEELQRARQLAPHDKSVVHSLADLEMRRADASGNKLERDRHLNAAQEIAVSITGRDADTSHGYHTICKVLLTRLEEQLEKNPDDQITISKLVKQVEERLGEGTQRFPGDSFLADAEARLASVIGQDDRAVKALERALKANLSNAFIAKALSRLYESNGDVAKARTTLEECAQLIRGDQTINAALARLITHHFPKEGPLAEYYWQRSYTTGDANYQNQFWHARQLYISGQTAVARELFRQLGAARASPEVKLEVKGVLNDDSGRPLRFKGHIQRLETSYAWVSRDGDSTSVFLHQDNSDRNIWKMLNSSSRISYQLGFNYKGPAATNPALSNE